MTAIDYIIENKIVENLIDAYNIPDTYKDDLIQEIYLIILQYDTNTLQQLYEKKQLKYYIAKIITNQFFSKTSSFYKTYKKYYKQLIDEQQDPFAENIENIDE